MKIDIRRKNRAPGNCSHIAYASASSGRIAFWQCGSLRGMLASPSHWLPLSSFLLPYPAVWISFLRPDLPSRRVVFFVSQTTPSCGQATSAAERHTNHNPRSGSHNHMRRSYFEKYSQTPWSLNETPGTTSGLLGQSPSGCRQSIPARRLQRSWSFFCRCRVNIAWASGMREVRGARRLFRIRVLRQSVSSLHQSKAHRCI